MYIRSIDCEIEISRKIGGIEEAFARRYIPEIEFGGRGKDAFIDWEMGKQVEILEVKFGKRDYFRIRAGNPQPYKNEHPYFFILQVFSRLYEKKGHILLTDSAVFSQGKKGILLLGPPHSGKSTLMVLAASQGFDLLSNENSVFDLRNEKLIFIGGCNLLTFSPMVKRYVEIEEDGKTRSGYGMLDLRKFERRKVRIEKIYYLHSSFSSKGFDKELIRGRKIEKILWDHASKVVSGGEFYKKFPLNFSTPELSKKRAIKVREMARGYKNKFFEVFGSHIEIFNEIAKEI